MCLYLARNAEVQARRDRAYLNEHRGQNEWTAWKVVWAVPAVTAPLGTRLQSWTFPFVHGNWIPGVHKSTRSHTRLSENERRLGTVEAGFHVYRTRAAAERCTRWFAIVILPVRVRRSEFVAADAAGEAVFRRVRVRKADYDRTLRMANTQREARG